MRAFLLAAAAASAILASGGQAARAQEAAPLTKPDVERIVRDYLVQNPEVVYQAIQELQRRQEAAEAKKQQAAIAAHKGPLYSDATDPVGGNPKGDVTLVEFFDYRCGYCRSMAAGVRGLLAQDPNIRYVFKDIPILSAESGVAAKAAVASAKQGKYQEFHFALMQAKDLTTPAIMEAAAKVGLDTKRLAADMESPEVAAKIDQNLKLAEALGVNGTPAFLVGDQMIPGATEVPKLAELVAKQRAAGG